MGKESLTEQHAKTVEGNRFLAAHCEKTLAEQAELLRGVSHSVNRCNAEYADCWDAVKELRKRCDSLEATDKERDAAIGRLQEQIQAIEEARKAYAAKQGSRTT